MESGEIGSFGGEGRGGSIPEKGSNPVTSLIKEQRQGLNIGDIGGYYDKWVVLGSEAKGHVPPEVHESIKNVSFGLGFLFYNKWGEMGRAGEWKQKAFQKRLQRHNMDELNLTYEQGKMLKDAAAAVNVAYDPGGIENTPENIKKRTFNLTDIEDDTSVVVTANVVPDGK